MSANDHSADPPAPGLQVVAIVEAAKGLLALLAASGLELLGPEPLRRGVEMLIAYFQFDPQQGFCQRGGRCDDVARIRVGCQGRSRR